MANTLSGNITFSGNDGSSEALKRNQCGFISRASHELRDEVSSISLEINQVQNRINHCNNVIDRIDQQVHVTMDKRNKTFSHRVTCFLSKVRSWFIRDN